MDKADSEKLVRDLENLIARASPEDDRIDFIRRTVAGGGVETLLESATKTIKAMQADAKAAGRKGVMMVDVVAGMAEICAALFAAVAVPSLNDKTAEGGYAVLVELLRVATADVLRTQRALAVVAGRRGVSTSEVMRAKADAMLAASGGTVQ